MTPLRRISGIGACLAAVTALGLLGHATPAMAIDGEVISVTRVYSDGSAEMVDYVVEDTGAWSIKFEDADVGLGEDHEQMTDIFVLRIPNSNGSVTVETKAATSTATSVLTGAGESSLDGLGFNVTLDSIEDDVYTISVTSESNHRALSHVTFFFFEGNFAEPLYD